MILGIMNLDFFTLGGYGAYVWPAFFFSLFSCFVLYVKTIKKFKKHEKLYINEFNEVKSYVNEGYKENKMPEIVLNKNLIS